jgi:hypothetical protein
MAKQVVVIVADSVEDIFSFVENELNNAKLFTAITGFENVKEQAVREVMSTLRASSKREFGPT